MYTPLKQLGRELESLKGPELGSGATYLARGGHSSIQWLLSFVYEAESVWVEVASISDLVFHEIFHEQVVHGFLCALI